MKGIKKCLLLALSFAMSMTLFAACGGEGDNSSSSSSTASESPGIVDGSSEVVGSSEVTGGSSETDISGAESDPTESNPAESNPTESDPTESNPTESVPTESVPTEDTSEIDSSEPGEELESSESGKEQNSSNDGDGSSSNAGGGIELPEIPDVDGEQIADETAWTQAWANTNAARNLTVKYVSTYTYEGKTETEYGVGMIADSKWYAYDYDDTNGYAYTYMGEVDGRIYEWTSKDGENWEVEETFVDIEKMTSGYVIVRGLDQMLDYSTAEYVDGYYVCATEWAKFKIKIADGYVVEIAMISDDETITYTMAFGGAEVGELPALPQGVIGEELDGADDWAKVLANTQAQSNFSYTAKGRADREDGKISVMTENVEVDNGNVYVERETAIHSGTGSATGTESRYYQGYVDGVAYEWAYTGDGYSAQQIETVEAYTVVELLGLEDLDFTTAQFDSETGGYAFATDDGTITVKAVDGLIAWIELDAGTMVVEYTVSYDSASVVLPPLEGNGGEEETPVPVIDFDGTLGDDIIGQEVEEDVFYKAIKNTYTRNNLTVKGYAYSKYDSGEGEAFGITYIADGKAYNYTTGTDSVPFHLYIGTVDGVEYVWMSTDGENWESGLAEDVGAAGLTNGAAFIAYLDMFNYSDCTFDGQTGTYACTVEIDDSSVVLELKIVDGIVVSITMRSGGNRQTFTLEYDNAKVGELPPLSETGGGDKVPDEGGNAGSVIGDQEIPKIDTSMIGEEVTAEEFAKILANTYAQGNFVYVQRYESESQSVVAVSNFADGKAYEDVVITMADENGESVTQRQFDYMGTVDGVTYVWISFDGTTWNCFEAADMGFSAVNGSVFATWLDQFVFADASFDSETGTYVMDSEEMTISLKVYKELIVEFSVQTSSMTTNYVIEYGNASVGELPPVTSGGSTGGGSTVIEQPTQEEWDEAFAALSNSTNHTLRIMQTVDWYDGTKTMENDTLVKMTESAVYQEYVQNTITAEGDTKVSDLGVWTQENGVDYVYQLSADSGWTKAEAETTVEELFQQMSSMFEVFADMYSEMSWNANGGFFYLSEYTLKTADGESGNTLYDVCVAIHNGEVIAISYRMEYDTYGGVMDISLYDYGYTTVVIPTEGSSENPNGDNGADSEIDVGENDGTSSEYVEVELLDLPKGEEVDEAAWDEAFAFTQAADNYTADMYMSGYAVDGDPSELVMEGMGVARVADQKCYGEQKVNIYGYGSRVVYSYFGYVDGVNYTWDSYDNVSWGCYASGYSGDINGAWMLDEMGLANVSFANVTYDETTGGYKYVNEDNEDFTIGIADGKIVFITWGFEEEGVYCTQDYVFTYGNTSVGDLPAVTLDGTTSGGSNTTGNGTVTEDQEVIVKGEETEEVIA